MKISRIIGSKNIDFMTLIIPESEYAVFDVLVANGL